MDILSKKDNLGGEVWCVFGDFNCICTLSDRVVNDESDRWISNIGHVELNISSLK